MQADTTEKTHRSTDEIFSDKWCSTPAKRQKTVGYKSATGIVYHKTSHGDASVTNGNSGAAWRRQGRDDEEPLASSFSNASATTINCERSSPPTAQKQTTDGQVGGFESETKLLAVNSCIRKTTYCAEERGTTWQNVTILNEKNPVSSTSANCRLPEERELAFSSRVGENKEIDDDIGSAIITKTWRRLTSTQDAGEVSGRRLLQLADDRHLNDEIRTKLVDDRDDRNFEARKHGYQSTNGVDFVPNGSCMNDFAPVCDSVAASNQIVCFRRRQALYDDRRRENWIPAIFSGRKRKIFAGCVDESTTTLWTIERPLLLVPTSSVSLMQLHRNACCQQIQVNDDTADAVQFSASVGRRVQPSARNHRQSATDPVAVAKSPLLFPTASAGPKLPPAVDQSASSVSDHMTRRRSAAVPMLSDCRDASGHVIQRSLSLSSQPTHSIKPPAVLRQNCIVAIDRRPLLVLNRHSAIGERMNAAIGAVSLDAILHGAARTTGCVQWLPQPTPASAAIRVQSPRPTVFMYPPETIGVPLNNRLRTSVAYPGPYSSAAAVDHAAYGIGFERLSTCFFEMARPVCHVEPPHFFVRHIL
jgi:hypothetical protein